jgi:hypothetical protein
MMQMMNTTEIQKQLIQQGALERFVSRLTDQQYIARGELIERALQAGMTQISIVRLITGKEDVTRQFAHIMVTNALKRYHKSINIPIDKTG